MTSAAPKIEPRWQRWHFWAFLGFVVLLSFLTYFWRYWNPPYVFWDENYHIASAQKYIHGVYFMEQHPPLGKLLIAAGEKLYNGPATAINHAFRPPATAENTWCCLKGDAPRPVNLAGSAQHVPRGRTCADATPAGSGSYLSTRPTSREPEACNDDVFSANIATDQFLGTDYGTEFPAGFSFVGYRFFSAFLAWLAAPLFFLIFYIITRRNPLAACLLSFLYIFDNALIVHARGAMLEGPLLFFSALVILAFFLLYHPPERLNRFLWLSVLFGVALALTLTTKVLGLIFILFIPVLLWRLLESPRDRKVFVQIAGGIALTLLGYGVLLFLVGTLSRRFQFGGGMEFLAASLQSPFTMLLVVCLGLIGIAFLWAFLRDSQRAPLFVTVMLPCFALVYCSIWYVHFSLGRTINPVLPDNGYYQASEEQKQILAAGTMASPFSFPVQLRDALKFVSHYNAGAPRLDLCKIDENGSPWFYWPLGGRTISYRWETPDGQAYRYLYLVPNPVVWWSALAALMIAGSMLLASVFFPPARPLRYRFLLAVFLGVYLCYFIAVSRIDRVMYLYHYFLPLQLAFVVVALVFQEIQTVGRRLLNSSSRLLGLMVLAGLVFLAFLFYHSFTYYEPMTDAQVRRRALFPLWEIRCVNCQQYSPVAIPNKQPGQ